MQLRGETDGARPWIWFGGRVPDERAAIAAELGRVTATLSQAEERRATVERLASVGLTQQQIADEVGVSRKTIQRDLATLRREVA
jgi:DNA-binding NarL/FixJ family response regulator